MNLAPKQVASFSTFALFLLVLPWSPSARIARSEPLFPYSRACVLGSQGSVCLVSADFDEDGAPDAISSDTCSCEPGRLFLSSNNGDGTFTSQAVTPAAIQLINVGDVNGDGHQDAVVANGGFSAVATLFGRGDGTFMPQTSGSTARGSLVADLNKDGKADMVSKNLTTFVGLEIYLGNGDGSFSMTTTGVDRNVSDIRVADFDGDGSVDLALNAPPRYTEPPGFQISRVRILFGSGDGTFSRSTLFDVAEGPIRIAAGDIDGNGRPDIAATVYYTGLVKTFYSQADGSFTAGATASGFEASRLDHVSVGDLNGDSLGDLVIRESGTLVLVNDGTGSFSLRENLTLPSGSTQLVDFNGDGILDFLSTNQVPGLVLLGHGDGTFVHGIQSPLQSPNYAQCVAAMTTGRFNQDAALDVAITNYCPPHSSPPGYPPEPAHGMFEIYAGDGHGGFSRSFAWTTDDQAADVVGADFDGDGKRDVAVIHAQVSDLSVHLGNGDGTLGAPIRYPLGAKPLAVVAADFNGDQRIDIAAANANAGDVSVLLNTGGGAFAPHVRFPAGSEPVAMTVADFNGDGIADLAVANRTSDDVSILLGTGSGAFVAQVLHPVGDGPASIASVDLDHDGRMDLVVANTLSNDISLLRGLAGGAFAPETRLAARASSGRISLDDFDRDGNPDILTLAGGDADVLLGHGDGTFSLAGTFAIAVPAGGSPQTAPPVVAVGDLDGDGLDDLVTSGAGGVGARPYPPGGGSIVVMPNQTDCAAIRPALTMDAAGLAWMAGCPGAHYDVATGSVDALRSHGDFSESTCVAQNVTTTSLPFGAVPPVGSADWFVVRVAGQSWNEGGEAVSRELSLSACP